MCMTGFVGPFLKREGRQYNIYRVCRPEKWILVDSDGQWMFDIKNKTFWIKFMN